MRRPKTWAWAAATAATLGICIATLHPGDGPTPSGWSFDLTAGDAGLGELIANLILFIPLGMALTLAGVQRRRVIAVGALLSFTVEFLQQWIPGRDPSVGDILSNTISTALGMLLVVGAPRWLFVSPRRSAWQARATALLTVLVWYGTGAMLRQTFPPLPYHIVTTPDFEHFGHYQGEVVKITPGLRSLEITAVAAPQPPGQPSPLIAVLDRQDQKVLLLSVDGPDLVLRYSMPAVRATLDDPDLRLRGALQAVAPRDTFIAKTWHDSTNVCLRLNAIERCHLGYTIGDGWKLIYYPATMPPWMLGLINMLWIVGCVIGVGYWAARGAAVKGGGGKLAMGIVIAGLLMVPLMTGLKATPVSEWIGALGGLALGWSLFRKEERSGTPSPKAAGYTTPLSHPGQTS